MPTVGQRQQVKALLKDLTIEELDDLRTFVNIEISVAIVNIKARDVIPFFGPNARTGKMRANIQQRVARELEHGSVTLDRLAKGRKA